MAKFCKVYKILCISSDCSEKPCGYSASTKAEAEIQRGCQLDQLGNVEEDKRKPTSPPGAGTQYSPAKGVNLPEWRPPEIRRFSRALAWTISILAIVFTLGTLVLIKSTGKQPQIAEETGEVEDIFETPTLAGPVTEPDSGIEVVVASPPPATQTPTPVRRAPQPTFQPPERLAELRLAGNTQVRQGNFSEARRHFLQMISAAPQQHEGYNNLANTYTDEGQHFLAEPIYIQSLRLDPSSTTARFNLANSYIRAGRWMDAEREFIHVLSLEPTDWEARLLYGVACYHQSKWREASAAFLDVLEKNPRNAHAAFNLHLTYQQAGAPHLAKTYLAEAVRLDPALKARR